MNEDHQFFVKVLLRLMPCVCGHERPNELIAPLVFPLARGRVISSSLREHLCEREMSGK